MRTIRALCLYKVAFLRLPEQIICAGVITACYRTKTVYILVWWQFIICRIGFSHVTAKQLIKDKPCKAEALACTLVIAAAKVILPVRTVRIFLWQLLHSIINIAHRQSLRCNAHAVPYCRQIVAQRRSNRSKSHYRRNNSRQCSFQLHRNLSL